MIIIYPICHIQENFYDYLKLTAFEGNYISCISITNSASRLPLTLIASRLLGYFKTFLAVMRGVVRVIP